MKRKKVKAALTRVLVLKKLAFPAGSLLVNEQGIALIVAMSVLTIILILGVTIFVAAQSALNLTVWDRSSNEAFHAAEAGFNQAVYKARANQLQSGVTTVTLENVEYRLEVTETAAGLYKIVSTGASPNFASPKARRAIAATVQAFNPWQSFYVSLSAGGTIVGNASIEGPFYTTDIFSLSGTGFQAAKYTKGPLYIKDNPSTSDYTGDLKITGNGQVGEASEPITLFIEGRFLPNTEVGNNLFYNEKYTEVPELDFPEITIEKLRSDYKPKASQIWSGNLYFDDSLGGKNPPTYPTRVIDTTSFDFYWRDNQKREGLLVFDSSATIYVTGNLRFGSNTGNTTTIYFLGKGTFIVEGNVSFSGIVVPSAGGSTKESNFSPDYASFPLTNNLGIITPYTVDMESSGGQNDTNRIYAALYGREKIWFKKQLNFYGASLTKQMQFDQNPSLHFVENLAKNLPPDMPQPQTTVSILSWKEVTPNQ